MEGSDFSRNGWKLTRTLFVDPPLSRKLAPFNVHSMSGFVSQKQDTTGFVSQIPPPKKKRKSLAQRRRARKRFQKWLKKNKSGTGYDQVTETIDSQQTADPKVLDTVNCDTIDQDQDTGKTVVSPQEKAAGSSDQATISRFTTGPTHEHQ